MHPTASRSRWTIRFLYDAGCVAVFTRLTGEDETLTMYPLMSHLALPRGFEPLLPA